MSIKSLKAIPIWSDKMQIKASLDSTKESGAPEQTNNDTELLVQESI